MLAACVLLGVVFLILTWFKRQQNLPPGPIGLPIIGNLHQLSPQTHTTFTKMRKRYGDIFSLQLGQFSAVVINEAKLVKKIFHMPACSGRPLTGRMIDTHHGIIFTQGAHWSEQRKFVLKTLRDFGLGKKLMEGIILDEIQQLIAEFKVTVGKPIMMQNLFNVPVLNALWTIVSGERYAHDDPRLRDLVNRLSMDVTMSKPNDPFTFFPFLGRARRLAPKFFGEWAEARAANNKANLSFMTAAIEKHQKNPIQDGEFQDLIEAYLAEVDNTTDPDSSFYKEKGAKNLQIVLRDLFLAGAETTSTTLTWACLLMALHPEIQDKVCREIQHVVGMSRLPSLEDRPKLPYVDACIMEVMRYIPLVPLGVFHGTTEDVQIDNYFIPKDTMIFSNIHCIHTDPEVWGDPENFRPTRFLSEDGMKLVKNEALIPFSTGKRVCLGESLARDELFLFVTSLFQNFRFAPDPKGPKLTTEYYNSSVLVPKPFRLIIHAR